MPSGRRRLAAVLLCLLSAAAHAEAPAFGPGSAAWTTDLAALEAAFESGSENLDAMIQEFGSTHRLLQSVFRLRRAAGEIRIGANGRSDPPNPVPDEPRYTVDGLCAVRFELQKYGRKLARLLPRVDAGEKSMDWARKKAAGFGFLTENFGLEVADLTTRKGVMVCTPRWDVPTLEIYRPGTWKPRGFNMFKSSWRDMKSRLVLDREYQVIEIDRDEPQEGYKSLLETLRVVGELAPQLPEGDPDELVDPPDPE